MLRIVQSVIRLVGRFCGIRRQFQDRYHIQEVIKAGEFATVRRCRAVATRKNFAVKIYRLRHCSREQSLRACKEAEVCSGLSDHRHIVQYHGSTMENGILYIVFSLLRGSHFFDGLIRRRSCSERDAAYYMEQIINGIAFLHRSNIVHADIRPENVIFKSKWCRSSVKIIDFKSAINIKSLKEPRVGMFGVRGRREYRAPEMVTNKKYGPGVDVWSAGVILCNLLTGNAPFEGASDNELYEKIKDGSLHIDFKAPEWQSVSIQPRKLVYQLLLPFSKERISATCALKHPFLRNHGLSLFLSKYTKKSVMVNLARLNSCQKLRKKSAPLRRRSRTVSDPVSDRLEYANASLRHLHLIDPDEPYLNDVATTSRPSLWPKASVVSRAGSRQSTWSSSSQDHDTSQYYSSSDDDHAKVATKLRPRRLPRKRVDASVFRGITEEFRDSAFVGKSRGGRSRGRDTVSRRASIASTSTSSRPISQGASCCKSTPRANESKTKKFPARKDKSLEASNRRDKVVDSRKRKAPQPAGTVKLCPGNMWTDPLAVIKEEEDEESD